MKKFNINIQEFLEEFEKQYDFLYDNANTYVAGYDEALAAGNEFITEHIEFVREFNKYRGDILSSDREVVAFMFALDNFTENFN